MYFINLPSPTLQITTQQTLRVYSSVELRAYTRLHKKIRNSLLYPNFSHLLIKTVHEKLNNCL